jgi:undecaprenyl diphosphate synthase
MNDIPKHIAIIMDGNGRWAQRRGLRRTEGHREATRRIPELIEHAFGHWGVQYLTLYAFSTENWNRPKWEINTLFLLARKFLKEKEKDLIAQEIRFLTIGDLAKFPQKLQEQIAILKGKTAHFTGKNLVMALNYGSRDEIVRAMKTCLSHASSGEFAAENVSWETISASLDTAGMPDPDLLIRTSGEKRLSNFLLLQAAYSELYFTDTLFPDFTKIHLDVAIKDFRSRERRYGKV